MLPYSHPFTTNVFIPYLHTKLHIWNSNNSLVTVIKMRAKGNFSVGSALFFYTIQKILAYCLFFQEVSLQDHKVKGV